MTDADRERILDARIMRRLATDREYLHAEDAEAQAAREEAITAQEECRLNSECFRAAVARRNAYDRDRYGAPLISGDLSDL